MTWCVSPLAAMLLAVCPQVPAEREYVIHFNDPDITFETHGATITRFEPTARAGQAIGVERNDEGDTTIYRGRYLDDGFILTVTRSACRDTITGARFSHEAFYTGNGLFAFGGCAHLASEPAPWEE